MTEKRGKIVLPISPEGIVPEFKSFTREDIEINAREGAKEIARYLWISCPDVVFSAFLDLLCARTSILLSEKRDMREAVRIAVDRDRRWTVHLRRTETVNYVIDVIASSQSEAREKALDRSGAIISVKGDCSEEVVESIPL